MEKIKMIIGASIKLKLRIMVSEELLNTIWLAQRSIANAFENNKKVLFCGNGGSAADAQYLAAEFSGRFYRDRPALYAEALHYNTSYLTAVANDYSYDCIYERLIEGIAHPGDVLVAISTSGNSMNIINAIKAAREKQMVVIGMTGKSGKQMEEMCDHLIAVPSSDTPRIQEVHIMIGHIICELVEAYLFNPNTTKWGKSPTPAKNNLEDINPEINYVGR
jgi:D-sedoheptulose 7-phosphate isomerase